MPVNDKINEFYDDLKRLRNFDVELSDLHLSEGTKELVNKAVSYEAEAFINKYHDIESPEKEHLNVVEKYFMLTETEPEYRVRTIKKPHVKITYKSPTINEVVKLSKNEALNLPVYKLDLPAKKKQALQDYFGPSAGGNTIYFKDILNKSKKELLEVPNFGEKTIAKLEEIARYYRLGYGLSDLKKHRQSKKKKKGEKDVEKNLQNNQQEDNSVSSTTETA